jgi:hypothetical protein
MRNMYSKISVDIGRFAFWRPPLIGLASLQTGESVARLTILSYPRLTILRNKMVKRYKPQLNHIGFDWFRDSNRILRALLAREVPLLTKAVFTASTARSMTRHSTGI